MSLHPEEPLTEEHLDGIFDMLDSLSWKRRELTCNSNCVTITMLEKVKKEVEESFRKEFHSFSNDVHKMVESRQSTFQFRTEQLERELQWNKQEMERLKTDLELERKERHKFERKFSQHSAHIPNTETGGGGGDPTCLECANGGTLAIISERSPLPSLPLQPPEFRKEVMELLQNLSNTIRHEIAEWNERHLSLQEELGKTKKDVEKLLLKIFPPPVAAPSLPLTPSNSNVSVLTLSVVPPVIEDISPAPTPAPLPPIININANSTQSLPPPPPSPRTVAASSALLELVQSYRGSPVETSNRVPVIKFSEPRDEEMVPLNLSSNFPPNGNPGSGGDTPTNSTKVRKGGKSTPPKVIVNYGIRHGIDGSRPLFCVCGKKCPSRTELEGHIRYHTVEKRFTCNFCGRNFRYAYSLRRHFMRVHNKICNMVPPGTF